MLQKFLEGGRGYRSTFTNWSHEGGNGLTDTVFTWSQAEKSYLFAQMYSWCCPNTKLSSPLVYLLGCCIPLPPRTYSTSVILLWRDGLPSYFTEKHTQNSSNSHSSICLLSYFCCCGCPVHTPGRGWLLHTNFIPSYLVKDISPSVLSDISPHCWFISI